MFGIPTHGTGQSLARRDVVKSRNINTVVNTSFTISD